MKAERRQTTFEFDGDKRKRRELICRLTISPEESKATGVSGRSIVQVALALEDHYSRQNCVWPSQAKLASITHLSERTVRRAVAWLRDRELVVVETRYMGPLRNTGRTYSFMWGAWVEATTSSDRPASTDRPTGQWRQTDRPVCPDRPASSVLLNNHSEQPLEQPHEQPQGFGGLKEIGSGGPEGDPDPIEVRRITFSIQAACGAWKQRLSRQDRDLIAGMAEDFAAGRISRDQILDALRETDDQLRRAAARGSPINQPINYLDRVLSRISETELVR